MKVKVSTAIFIFAILAAIAIAIAMVSVIKMQIGGISVVEQKGKVLAGTQEKGVITAATSKDLALSDAELKNLRPTAVGGDCAAALKLARHYSFAVNELEESVKWLRIAAKCDDIDAKSQLILMILATESDTADNTEIIKLLSEIHKLDVTRAEEIEEMVSSRRRKKG